MEGFTNSAHKRSYASVVVPEAATPETKRKIDGEPRASSMATDEPVFFGERRITDLPKEQLLQHIFSFCAPLDLNRLNLVCRHFKDNVCKPVWVSSLTSVGAIHQKKYGRMTCSVPELADELNSNLISKVPFLQDIEKPGLESDILVGFWSETKKLVLSARACRAIRRTDMSGWDAASLTHTLVVLLKANWKNPDVRGAQKKVCLAIKTAGKSDWDAASLAHTLEVLLKADQRIPHVRDAQNKVCKAIKTAGKSGWDAASLAHTLEVLLKADQTNPDVISARNKVCREIELAEKSDWDAAPLTRMLEALSKTDQRIPGVDRASLIVRQALAKLSS